MINTAQVAARTHDFWKAELARLEPHIGRNKAIVAIARKMLVAVWHVLTKQEADRHADVEQVARHLMNRAYVDVGARNLPGGQTAPEFVRAGLDKLKLGKDMQRLKRGKHEYLLPPSTQPGAAPVAEPRGQGRRQNTKAAQEKRLADGAAKREALAAKRQQPRKVRSDQGVKRGPRAKK